MPNARAKYEKGHDSPRLGSAGPVDIRAHEDVSIAAIPGMMATQAVLAETTDEGGAARDRSGT